MEMRCYVAIPVNSGELFSFQDELKGRIFDTRWLRREKLHLTVLFMGEYEDVVPLQEAFSVSYEAVRSSMIIPSAVDASGPLLFPPGRRPRVVALQLDDVPDWIKGFRSVLEVELTRRSIGFDGKNYRPHITLGYLRKGIPSLPESKTLTLDLGRPVLFTV